MSATIDPTPFLNFLGPDHTQVVYIEGRRHPIKILNVSQSLTDYVADAASVCIRVSIFPTLAIPFYFYSVVATQ